MQQKAIFPGEIVPQQLKFCKIFWLARHCWDMWVWKATLKPTLKQTEVCFITTVLGTYGFHFRQHGHQTASTECRWRQVSQRHTCQNPYGARWHCQPVPALATRLGHGPVYYSGPTMHWSFSVAGRIPALYRTLGLCHLSTLQRRWRGSTVSSVPSSRRSRRDVWPEGKFNTDPRCLWNFLERIETMTHPPPWPGMREREWQAHVSKQHDQEHGTWWLDIKTKIPTLYQINTDWRNTSTSTPRSSKTGDHIIGDSFIKC